MSTLTKSQYHDKLAETMKRLGENTSNSYILVDATDSMFPICYCNDAYKKLTGYSERDLLGKSLHHVFNHIENDIYEQLNESIINGKITSFETYHSMKEGNIFQCKIECFPLQNEEAQLEFIFIVVTDISYKKLLKHAEDLERRMFRAIEKEKTLHDKLTLVCEYIDKTLGPDMFSTIVMNIEKEMYISSAVKFEDSTTHLIPKGMAQNYYKLLMELDDSRVYTRHKGYALSPIHQQYALDKGLLSCWQIPIPIHQEKAIGVITIFFKVQKRPREFYNRFITTVIMLLGLAYNYEMKRKQIYYLAYTDISTGLPNRHDFLNRLSENKQGLVMFVQPSEFSKFIELYGRNFGDEVIKQLAAKFSRIPEIELIGQFSSSVLALQVLEGNVEQINYVQLFEKISKEPLNIFGNEIYSTLKIGIEKCHTQMSSEVICRNAESALAFAKTKTGMRFEYYNEEIQIKLKKELNILNELVGAIKNKEFQVYVQPKIEMYRGRIYGMEALARWISPKLGEISPADFIPVAESAGLIREIDLQIIEQVLKWMQQRLYEGNRIIPVALNISPDHFYHPQFIASLKKLIRKYYADPKFLIIEVTESLSLVDINRASKIINQLRVMGIQVSVDDFGIGYSSLSYLQRLYFSELKLDRSFVRSIHESGTYLIMQGIIQIAHNLGITTVAEGIENEQQYNLLKKLGCNVAQGYYFFKPIPMTEISEYIIK